MPEAAARWSQAGWSRYCKLSATLGQRRERPAFVAEGAHAHGSRPSESTRAILAGSGCAGSGGGGYMAPRWLLSAGFVHVIKPRTAGALW